MSPISKKLGGYISFGLSVRPSELSVRPFFRFETSHIFGIIYARILKFQTCIADENSSAIFFFLL